MAGEQYLYKIGEVAAMLGVSAHTIRAWERRHGILRPLRTIARQRRYRLEDVGLLREVKRAIDLNGLSVRLAFETVTRGSGTPEPQTTATAKPDEMPDVALPAATDGAWRAVANVLSELILLIDHSGNVVEANTAAARTFDVVRQKLAGRTFASMVEPWDRDKAALMYRTQPRSVDGWEVNLTTPLGPRLFSFQSWSIRRGEDELVALIGSEMFAAAYSPSVESSPGIVRPRAEAASEFARQPGNPNALQVLLDQLPFGLALATIGAEPRLLYANLRLSQMLRVAPSAITGQPVRRVLPNETVLEKLRQAAASRTSRTLQGVREAPRPNPAHRPRSFDIAFRPLVSSVRKVSGVLIVVQEATTEVVAGERIRRFESDRDLRRARSTGQLGRVALKQLGRLMPGIPVGLALPAVAGSAHELSFAHPAPIRGAAGLASAGAFQEAVTRATAGRGKAEVPITLSSKPYRWTAVSFDTGRGAGAIAWLTLRDSPLSVAQNRVIDAFVARIEIVIELLQRRAESSRARATVRAITSITVVVEEKGRRADLATRFLQRLVQAVGADSAAIGRVAGSQLVIETVYPATATPVRPGDRFPMTGRFVSQSVRTGRAIGSADLHMTPGPPARKPTRHHMGQALSVPLKFMGRISHVVMLARAGEQPFGPQESRLVQALTGVALFCIAVSNNGRPH